MATPRENHETAAGGELAAVSLDVRRVRLTAKMLRELRLALLTYTSPLSIELELVEERYGNGDVVVRLARPDKLERGELILGGYKTGEQRSGSLLDAA